MTKIIHLSKSPIVESVLDFRTVCDPNLPTEVFEKYYTEVKNEYSIKQVNTLWEASWQVKEGEAPKINADTKHNGFVFKTPDNSKAIQFRRDGFTFNLLNSYTDWNTFSNEAKNHFQKYIQYIAPKIISRIAVRTINLLELPLPFDDFNEYILTVPVVAKGLPQKLSELQMRLALPDKKNENVAIITESIDLNRFKKNRSVIPFIFDIDVFRIMNIEANIELLWNSFDGIKNYRNEIFFKSMTNKTLKLYK